MNLWIGKNSKHNLTRAASSLDNLKPKMVEDGTWDVQRVDVGDVNQTRVIELLEGADPVKKVYEEKEYRRDEPGGELKPVRRR